MISVKMMALMMRMMTMRMIDYVDDKNEDDDG